MASPIAWLEAAQQFLAQQQAYALVTVLRVTPPTSARPGDKAVVTADGTLRGWIGGGCAQPAVIKTARLALADGQPRTLRITPASESEEKQLGDVLEFGMSCHSGGTLELFVDPVLPQEPLVVFGDSPVARALCDLAPRVGFAVHWVAQGAVASDAPAARRVLDEDDAAAVAAAVPPASWVVVATQGRRDMPALTAALQRATGAGAGALRAVPRAGELRSPTADAPVCRAWCGSANPVHRANLQKACGPRTGSPQGRCRSLEALTHKSARLAPVAATRRGWLASARVVAVSWACRTGSPAGSRHVGWP